jgi:mRNA interferase ChpB
MARCFRNRQGNPVKRGDIYMVSLNPTLGREQQGHRPVLIVSPSEFNTATKLPVVLPITNGGDFARRIGFGVEITGIKTTGLVRCDQPRVLDIAERGGRKVDTLSAALMEEVLAKVVTLFE